MRKPQSKLLAITLNCLIILSVSEIVSFSQIYNSAIKEKFGFQDEYVLSEKLYLQLDRNVYVTGENIFFKAYYFFNGTFHRDSISSIVYIDLVDDNGQVHTNGKYPVENGMANGALSIQEGLVSGYYTIYAYTKWMMNFGKACLFSRKIYIINPESEIKILKDNELNDENVMLYFYTEGGYIKTNTNNRISVVAASNSGKILEKKVIISDPDNKTVAEFQTPGYFDFIPEQNKKYKALIFNDDGSQTLFNLPGAYDISINTMLFHSINGNIRIEIELTDTNSPDNKDLKILLENNGLIYKQIDIEFFNYKYQLDIQKKELLQGLNMLYIINEKNQIIYKNSFINRFNDNFQIGISLNKEKYNAREKVDISINTKSADASLKNAHLSVSIAKSDLLNPDTINISDYLNNSSNRDRHIYNYHGNGMAKILSTIDSNTIEHSSEIVYLPETSGIIISGTILSAKTNKPIPNVNLYLSTLSDHIEVQNTITRNDGRFYFLMNEKIRNTDFVIQPADQSLLDFKLIMDKAFLTDYPTDDKNLLEQTKFNKKFFEELAINYQIKKQYYPDSQSDNAIMEETTLFYGKADTSYSFQKFIELPSFREYFTEIFDRAKVVNSGNGSQIKLSYLNNSAELNQFPLILIDGMPVFDVDKFLSISPLEIDKVDIINNYYALGGMVYGGIIHLYTKKKNFASLIDTKNLTFNNFTGLTKATKFREINYTDGIALSTKKADYRNTLYWNPEVTTDDNGEAHISFYTSDETGKFLITIEGAGENGETGSTQLVLEVE